MPTLAIADSDFDEKVLKSTIPIIVDFWAPWCGPCRLAEPILEELSDQYKDKIVIAKLNVDENTQSARKYNVMSIPTTIFFKEGKEFGRQVGFAGKGPFEELIEKGISS